MKVHALVLKHYKYRLFFSSILALAMGASFVSLSKYISTSFLAMILISINAVIFAYGFLNFRTRIENNISIEEAAANIVVLKNWKITKLFELWSHHLIGVMITGLIGLYVTEIYKISGVTIFKVSLIIAIVGDSLVPFREIKLLKKIARRN